MRSWILVAAMLISQTMKPDMNYSLGFAIPVLIFFVLGMILDASDFVNNR